MAPKLGEDQAATELEAGKKLAHPEPGDEVVISGLAGVFPNTDNVTDFAENLFAKIDLISDDDRRWKMDHPEIPHRTGKLNNITKFDASFFGIHYKQAHTMDPMCRILLEKSYEAIVDSGYNPRSLYGSRIGVFIGACFSESEKTWLYEKLQVNGFGITGCSRAMLANRISYWLGVNGPSYTVDSACSSSMYAFEHGYRAIRDGECDAAIIGGCNLCLHPYVSLQFARLGVLSMDGKCKPFDDTANGYCRSEAVCAIFLQKKKDARRLYATVVHVKTNCDGYKDQGITYPSGPQQQILLEDFYKECEIDPSTLGWVEAHGTGTKVGDPEELKAIENAFCKNRKEPLKIGSVKSNIGHTEPASGVCSITKVIISMETGFLPPNINFTTPKADIEGFHNGKLEVITEKTPWEGGLVGVNSFGFGGANGHVLLKWNEKAKVNNSLPKDDLPRLVSVSGRTEEAVNTILTYLETHPIDAELVKLLHEIHRNEIPGHLYRGYTILSKHNNKCVREIKHYSGKERPVWFIFSGLGSEWVGMGSQLMVFPTFATEIQKCHQALKSYNVDLNSIIYDSTVELRNNPVYCTVGITAIQIGIVALLKSIGVNPDGYIGQSFGEIGCAYADGTLSTEQAIIVSYHMGCVFGDSSLINGSMALIGAYKEEILRICPLDVEIVSDFGENCLISGERKSIKKIISIMKEKNRSVNVLSANSACHSSLIKSVGPLLMNKLKKVIPQPKRSSEKWISTSLKKRNSMESSAEYFCNNIISPIYLNEAIQQIPNDAVIIEIAPDGLLQTFIHDSMNKDLYLDVMNKNTKDNCNYFLSFVGKLIEHGANLNLDKLYPEVSYPVSRSTPMIAPLVKWEHSEDWYVTTYRLQDKVKSGERTVTICLKDEDQEYISGHNIDGRNLFPATGYLALVWQTLGLMRGDTYTEIPVVFENVRFLRATNLTKDGSVDFVVMVQKVSGHFEIVEGGVAVVTGQVYVPNDIDREYWEINPADFTKEQNEDELPLSSKDIYKELRLRGYYYKGLFRGLSSADNEGINGRVQWNNNWVAYMDNILQIIILQMDSRALFVPTSIDRVVIDVKKHARILNSLADGEGVPVYANKGLNLVVSGGVQIRGMVSNCIPRRKPMGEPILEKHMFIPHNTDNEISSVNIIVRTFVQFALENEPSIKVKAIELADTFINSDGPLLTPMIAQTLGDLPLIQADISVLSPPNNPLLEGINSDISVEDKKIVCDQSALIVTASDILGTHRSKVLENCLGAIKDGGFIIAREKPNSEINLQGLTKCAEHTFNGEQIILLKKEKREDPLKKVEVVNITNNNFAWLDNLKNAIKNEDIGKIYVISQNEKYSGILGLINCVRKESGGSKVRTIFIMDDNAPIFSLENPFYATQIRKDFATSVFKDGKWGSYFHLPLDAIDRTRSLHAYVNVTSRGDLSSLKWIQGPITSAGIKSDDKNLFVTLYYSALNFRDIMTATGRVATQLVADSRLNQECVQGLEFAGIDINGRRVMGMSQGGALASIYCGPPELLWEVPDKWTLEEAVTIPIVYGTVVYSFIKYGKICKGESVLIHSGAGGVGLAAINFALYIGCTVFTTVGTKEKREFIKQRFPQLTDNCIGNSRDTSFEQLVMKETNGRGVDIVLNSLSEEKLLASVRCLAPGGRFLEIGKFDLGNNSQLGMDAFTKERSFQGVMLDKVFQSSSENQKELHKLLKQYLDTDAIVPLPTTTFQNDEIEQAFRFMATGKHVGKVVIKVRNETTDPKNPGEYPIPAIPQVYCNPLKSYIVIGGLGGFGLELADWLVLRGARKLVLSSRSGLKNGYQSMRVRIWKSYGVTVKISTADVTTEHGVQTLLTEANSLGPVGGIYNLAVVLKDALLDNLNENDFEISFGPKANATKYLDICSRSMCPELDKFVVFSSVSCGRGNTGQANYGMANSVMERICEVRAAEGLPALAVQWGAVGDVGIVAEMQEEHTEVVIGGTLQQQISSCLKVMDFLMNQKHPVVSSMVVAEKRAGKGESESIVDVVANIIGLRDLKTISLHSTLAELGMDSMMAVEIKQAMEREFDVFFTPQDIRGMTFAKLNEYVTKELTEEKQADTDKRGGNKFGLNFLVRVIGEEKDSIHPIVRLSSKYDSTSHEQECNNLRNPVFVFPGMEGQASIMNPLALNLDFPVFGIQYDYHNSLQTIEDMALSLLPHIKKHLLPEEPFNIIGYSFGGIVAMEVVKCLEQEGFTGNLCLLDSSHEFIAGLTAEFFSLESEDVFQTQLLLRCVELIWPQSILNELESELRDMKTWESKVNFFVDASPFNEKYSSEYQKLMMTSIYNRLKAGFNYKGPQVPLSSPIALVRPTDIAITTETEDYGLNKISKNDVKVHFTEGDHWTFLLNTATADIINETMTSNKTIDFKNTLITDKIYDSDGFKRI